MKNFYPTLKFLILFCLIISSSKQFAQQANQIGEWSDPIPFGLVPVAVANLPDGNLIVWSSKFRDNYGGADGFTYYELFDPFQGQDGAALGFQQTSTNHDMFCPGINNLPDGRLLVSGGSSNPKTTIYDYKTNAWIAAPNMNVGRGYQGNVTLSDGGALTFGGSWSGIIGRNGEKIPEVWTPDGGWRALSGIPSSILWNDNDAAFESLQGIYRMDNHAWLWPAPNGKLFHAGPSEDMHWLDTSGNGSWSFAGKRGTDDYSMKGTTVMYDIGKILKVGGAHSYSSGDPAKDNSYVIDINVESNVTVTPTANNLSFSRTMHNSTVLPNGKVLVTGGLDKAEVFTDVGARLTAELYDPVTNSWSNVAGMQVPRTYHSVAILMQDARVFVGGGGLCGTCVNHMDAEIYSPPYLYDQNGNLAVRPTLNAPEVVEFNDVLQVTASNGIQEFVFIRMSSATHSTNNEQRRVPVAFTNNGTTYDLTIPGSNIMPPGYYMLFALDANGVPSVAESVRVGFSGGVVDEENLLVNFTFEEGQGDTVIDISGMGNNGIIKEFDDQGNSVPLSIDYWNPSGVEGSGLQMDGLEFNSNSILEIPPSPSLSALTNQVTVMAWVNRNTGSIVSQTGEIANVAILAHDYPEFFFGLHNSQYKLEFFTDTGETASCYVGLDTLGEWVHLAGTYNGSVARLYVNGLEICTQNLSGNLLINTTEDLYNTFTISGFYDRRAAPIVPYGNSSGVTDEIDGTIDNFKLYNIALDRTQIQEIFNEEKVNITIVADCAGEDFVTPEYRIDGVWQDGQNTISIAEGTLLELSALPNTNLYNIIDPNGNTLTDNYDLGEMNAGKAGIYTFVNQFGCSATLEILLQEPQDCDGVNQVITEYNVNGTWLSGDSILEFQEGTEIIISALPNTNTYTIADPNGNIFPDNYNIGGLSSSTAGLYIIENQFGCTTTLELRVLSGPDCDGAEQVIPEHKINNVWSEGLNVLELEEGTLLELSALPNENTYIVIDPSGTEQPDNFELGAITESDEGIYTIRNQFGCETTIELIVNQVNVPVTAINLKPTTLNLVTGGTAPLTAQVIPANASNQAVTWGSSDTNIATVNGSGIVSAIGAGSATITATTVDGGFEANSTITVSRPVIPVTGVSISNNTLTLTEGQTGNLTATVTPADADNKTVTWSSSDEAVATVDTNGEVTAVSEGTATITVTTNDGGFEATSTITVERALVPVIGVTVAPTTLTLTEGQTGNLTATVSPADADNKTVTWSSSDEAVATVDTNGEVTGVSEGTVTITATTNDGGFEAASTITVERALVPVTGVTVAPTTLALTEGQTGSLTATVSPAEADDQTVTWSSSDEAVATVDTNGEVTAVSEGTATIIVTTNDGGFEATSTITVERALVPVTGVTVAPTTLALTEGQTGSLTATVSPAEADDQTVTWSSSDEAVATVDANGEVTAVSEGTATITATTNDGGFEATAEVTVNAPAASLPWVEDFTGLANGSTVDTGETAWDTNGNFEVLNGMLRYELDFERNFPAVWTSEEVDISGVGSVSISLFVDDEDLGAKEEVDYLRAYYILDGGTRVQFAEVVDDIEGQVLSLNGLSGSTVRVELEAKSSADNERFLVDNIEIRELIGGEVPVTGITIDSDALLLPLGGSSQLVATVSPLDATDQAVSWSSSDDTVATVDTNGNVTAVSEGTAVITATTNDGGFTATAEVTVRDTAALPWSEDFTGLANGSTVDTGETAWSTNENFEVLNGMLRYEIDYNRDFPAIWTSEEVDISGAGNVRISLTVDDEDLGAKEDTDYLRAYYILDGGTRVQFAEVVGNIDSQELSVEGLTGSTLRLELESKASADNERFLVDDIVMEDTGGGTIAVTGVTVAPTELDLLIGGNGNLTATVSPVDATDQTVSWSSSDDTVVTVGTNGEVTAVSEGTATITATTNDGGFEGTATITVNIPVVNVTGVTVAPTELDLLIGGNGNLTATVSPVDATDQTVSWSSSDDTVATVGTNGEVTAVSEGTATITATTNDGGFEAIATITVNVPVVNVTGVTVAPTELDLLIGGNGNLTATVSPVDATDQAVSWSSSDDTVATVGTNGEVTAVSEGTATITATTNDGGFEGTATITVNVPVVNVTGVTVAPTELDLLTGGNGNLTATVSPVDATDQTVSWSSSDDTVVTVGTNGEVTAVSEGTATITATTNDGGFEGTATITVNIPVVNVTGVTVAPTELDLLIGGNGNLTATVSPVDATDQTVSWSSSDDTVATVGTNGEVTAVSEGTATITATTNDGGFEAIATITVNVPVVNVTGVTVAPTELDLLIGGNGNLTATVSPVDATDQAVSWSSSDDTVATVGTNGEVTAVSEGTATITATTNDGGFEGTATITVNVPVVNVTGVTVAPTELDLLIGGNGNLTATVSPVDATDQAVSWSSSDDTVATVGTNGEVTAVSEGTATITATTNDGGFEGTATITVNVPVVNVTGVTVAPTELDLLTGGNGNLTATVSPVDATDQTVSWSSSDDTVVTVGTNGEVTAVSEGTATITATTNDGGFEATTLITVNVNCEASVFIEDFESGIAGGWTTSGTASTGTFIVGNPTVQTTSGVITQPDGNHTPDGVNAYFTAFNTSVGSNDVDGGVAIAQSPVYSVIEESELSLWYFFGQRDIGDDSGDFFLLEYSLNGGSTFTDLVSFGDERVVAQWTEVELNIPANSDLVLRISASDGTSTGDIIEAGIDDISIISSCSSIISVTGVSVEPTSLTLNIGQDETLNAIVTPTDADDTSVSWISSDTNIATVDTNGLVTAVSTGTANITATTNDGGFQAIANVTVQEGSNSGELPWSEDFSGLSNGTVIDNGTTAWSTSIVQGTFDVQGSRLQIASPSVGNLAVAGTWTSEVIDITGYTDVSITLDVDDEDGNKENSDYVRAFYSIDGGAPVQFGEVLNDISLQQLTVDGLAGSIIQLIIEAKVSWEDENYFIDNIVIDGTGDSGSGCETVTLNDSGFETGWENWIDGGGDAIRNTEAPSGGSWAINLRDDSGSESSMSLPLDLSPFNTISVEFDYFASSFENGEDFFLEISTDGGTTFSVVENWVEGGNPDIIEDSVQSVSLNYTDTFTEDSVLRFRCDASGNSDDVYIDNVRISGSCSGVAGLKVRQDLISDVEQPNLEATTEEVIPTQLISNLRIAPNPIQSGQGIMMYLDLYKATSASVRVMNLSGQILSAEKYELTQGNNEINVGMERLAAGVYLVEVSAENERFVKRLIVE